jgi:hypothetical protein
MGTPLQNQGNAVLNALDDGACSAIVTLYDKDLLPKLSNRVDDIRHYLELIVANQNAIDYWMEYVK